MITIMSDIGTAIERIDYVIRLVKNREKILVC